MGRVKVLVVEDEPLIAFDLEATLDNLGCDTVGPTAFVTEAQELAMRETFDCAILDVNVRGGSITSVAKMLLDRGVPILLTTGYSDWALADSLSDAPKLRKPYTSEQLESALRSMFARVKH